MKLMISVARLDVCKKIFAILMMGSWCGIIQAAEIQLTISDTSGKPLNNAVAALVPEIKPVFNTPAEARIDQRNRMFIPGVMAVRTNTLVRFPNSDDIRHHVYSFSPAKKFELRLYHGMTAQPVLFEKPGTVVLGCNIHDSMVAYIYVVDTEYFALSDASGNIRIQAPAGKYQLQVYHPRQTGGAQENAVILKEQQPLVQKIQLDNLSSEAANKETDEFSGLF